MTEGDLIIIISLIQVPKKAMRGPHHDINHDMCVPVCESVTLIYEGEAEYRIY